MLNWFVNCFHTQCVWKSVVVLVSLFSVLVFLSFSDSAHQVFIGFSIHSLLFIQVDYISELL